MKIKDSKEGVICKSDECVSMESEYDVYIERWEGSRLGFHKTKT